MQRPNLFDLLLFTATVSSIFLGFIIGYITKKTILFKKKERHFLKLIEEERKAKLAAQEQIKARDEFLSITSHELKTPLTTIILRIQSTLDSILNQSLANFSGERLVESLNIAQQQTRRLQLLIKDLLNFSLITTGKMDLDLKAENLTNVVKETLKRFDDHITLAGCQLKADLNGDINGMWDQVRIEQAVSNLLTNAIKYGQGGAIEVKVEKHSSWAKIMVSDNGIGIDPSKQKIIFERFQRGTKDGKYQGLGVGLFIAKQITQAHGGRINVKSKLGSGSKFTIELPIKEAPVVKESKFTSLPKPAQV